MDQTVHCLSRNVFHGKRHPSEMGAAEIETFLTALAVQRHVSASTQNQALAALLFLYKEVLVRAAVGLDRTCRSRQEARKASVVLTRQDVQTVLSCLTCVYRIIGSLLYGGGLRLSEVLSLRVKDLDFIRTRSSYVTVRGEKTGSQCCRKRQKNRC